MNPEKNKKWWLIIFAMMVVGSIFIFEEGHAAEGTEKRNTPIPFDSFSDIEKVQKLLITEFPMGTSWGAIVERLASSGVACDPVKPYGKLNLPDGITMSESTKRHEEITKFRVRCSTAPKWLLFRSFHGITIEAELDKDQRLLLIVATPYYKHS